MTAPAVSALRSLVGDLRDREFPWTAATIYLNNAAIGPIPERTRLALEAFNAKRTAPHLLPDRDLFPMLDAARRAAARLIGAEPGEIALMPSTSAGLNVAARALPLAPGDVVLLSDREFPANVYPWLALRRQGVVVEIAPVTPEGFPDEDYLVERLADPRVRALVLDSMHAHALVSIGDGLEVENGHPSLPGSWAIVAGVALRLGTDWTVVDPVRTIVQVGNRPVLLTHGTSDLVDRPAESADLNFHAALAASVPVALQYCRNGTHGAVIDTCPDAWARWVTSFLEGARTRG